MDDKLLTTDQVASLLQVHSFTVLKWLKTGKLKGVRLGRVWRVRASDVEIFIEERTGGGKKEIAKADEQEKNPKSDDSDQDENDHYVI